MTKILSQAGQSLADIYDVAGSIAGIEQLETRELPIVHEMGSTVFSERLAGSIITLSSGAIAQNIDIGVEVADLPATPVRIYAVQAYESTLGRTEFLSLAVANSIAATETDVPVWTWDTNVDGVRTVRNLRGGLGPGNDIMLVPNPAAQYVPTMMIGTRLPEDVGRLVMRGRSAAFGAGTLTVTMVIYLAFAELQGVSSRGLPLPSW